MEGFTDQHEWNEYENVEESNDSKSEQRLSSASRRRKLRGQWWKLQESCEHRARGKEGNSELLYRAIMWHTHFIWAPPTCTIKLLSC